MGRSAQLNGHAGAEKKIGKKKSKSTKPKADSVIFASYIGEVVKDVYPKERGISLSGKTTRSLSALLASLETTLTADAKRIANFSKKATILPVSVQVALATRLPRALTEHAARDGAEAVVKFESMKKVSKKNGSA